MRLEILEMLRKKSVPRDWDGLQDRFQAEILGYEGQAPIYKFYTTLTDSLEVNTHSISVAVQPCQSYIPYHQHNFAEMIIPLLGSCEVISNGQKILVEQENIMVVGKGTTHRVENIDSGVIVVNISLRNTAFSLNDLNFMLHIGFNQSISSMLFSLLSGSGDYGAKYSLFRINHERKIVDLIYDIIEEYYGDHIQDNQVIHYDLLSLFTRLLRLAYQKNQAVKVATANQGNSDVLSLLLYIEKNYATITLEAMALEFGFNPNYLSAYLKKNTGLTFIKLVHLQRINVAADYLANTSVAIDKIAARVGYENPSYFYKIFKKHLQCSPSEYRQKMYQAN